VAAIRCHGRPTELKRQKGEKDDGEEVAHGRQSSGYMLHRQDYLSDLLVRTCH
jgi:hypothetical protein